MFDFFKYECCGVLVIKFEVYVVIKGLDKGLYLNVFCKIFFDFVVGDLEYCNFMYVDMVGIKLSLVYMYWKEIGDLLVWEGIVQDVLVMNFDDMVCVGCVDDIIILLMIGCNKGLVFGDVIKIIIQYMQCFVQEMEEFGVKLYLAGGEIVDVGDIVCIIDVGYIVFGCMCWDDLLVNYIQFGDVVVGYVFYG